MIKESYYYYWAHWHWLIAHRLDHGLDHGAIIIAPWFRPKLLNILDA